MKIRPDNLPMEVLEVYDTIEKLLSPKERIVKKNIQASDCILMMLNNLYFQDPGKDDKKCSKGFDAKSHFCIECEDEKNCKIK